uniref:Uncharacterized protein n=1 Tax=Plectus sambesii TaxID=2011161 RepID=A0A914W1H7_9BILA
MLSLSLSTNSADMLHVDADLSDHDERSGGRKGDPLAVGQFIAGFSECIRQIQKFGGGKEVGGDQVDEDSAEGDSRPSLDSSVRHQLTDFLLSYLKNFSDDATQSFKGDADHPLQCRASPRLKTISNSSGGHTSPLSHHSPTGSSLSSPKSLSNLSPLGSDGESPRKSEPKTDDESGSNSNMNSRENLSSRVFSPSASSHPYRVPLRLPQAARGGGILHYDASQASLNSRASAQEQFQAASAAALLQQMSTLPAFSLVNTSASHMPMAVHHQLQLLGSRPYANLWRPF